jgi:hypothetical protein
MGELSYQISNRKKKCRICEGDIQPHTWSLLLENVHVPPKRVNLFFHEGCFERALQNAKKYRNKIVEET